MSEALFDGYEPEVIPEPRPEPIKWTERMMLDLLNDRYSQAVGNGPRYARAEHVKSEAGFDASRIADFIAMDMWPSKGLALHGHEVKVSRSDWLCELRDPSKAEAFRPYMDYWWLVVSDKTIVRDDLPEGWGLMAVSNGRLRIVKSAQRQTPEPMPKSLLACLLRATTKTAKRGVLLDRRGIDFAASTMCSQHHTDAPNAWWRMDEERKRGWRDRAAAVLESVRQATC